MRGTFNSDWHGVPAGTPVIVHSVQDDLAGNKIAVVERVDGEDLPGPFCRSKRGAVGPEFITTDDQLPEE